jgi:hypothetical protein
VLLFTANRSECPLGGNQYSECECDLYSCVRRWSTVDAGAVREEDFGSSWWGYSVGDVDDFLESVAVSIETGRPLGPIFAEAVFRRSVRGYKRAQIDSYLHRLMSESGEFSAAALGRQPVRTSSHWDLDVLTRSAPARRDGAVGCLVSVVVLGVAVVAFTAWLIFGAGSVTLGRWWSWFSGGGPTWILTVIWAGVALFAGANIWVITYSKSKWFDDRLLNGPHGEWWGLWVLLAIPLMLFSVIMIGVAFGPGPG